jgi:hypothetical protein
MPADRVYKCRVRPCQNVKGVSNHWFVVTIDKLGRFIAEKFDNSDRFAKAANVHGANEVCSERCLHIQQSRWAQGRITASDKPACGSPAFQTHTTLTAWVSTVYTTKTFEAGKPGDGKRPARIVNYRDEGVEKRMWCFNQDAFPRVEAAIGAHVKFRIQRRKDYAVILDVLEVLDAPYSLKGEKDVNTATTASI